MAEPKTARSGRVVAAALAAALALAIAAIVLWLTIDWRGDTVRAALHSYDLPADGVLPVTIEVDRDPDLAVTCELVAVDRRFIVVGQLTLDIPPGGESRQRIDAEIPLRGDGIAPDLRGCSADS